MNDLARWGVHGPVETLRTEWAEWDQAKNDWQPFKRRTSARFRTDGQIIGTEAFNPDGSVARTACVYNQSSQIVETSFQMNDGPASKILYLYDGDGIVRTINIDEKGVSREPEIYRYDSSGRKAKIQVLPKVEGDIAYSVDFEGAASLFGTSGAATMTTVYDDQGHATEILVHDAAHRLLRRTTMTQDGAARPVKQEVRADREALKAALAAAFGPNNVLVTITNAYDEKGRRVERAMTMGTLGGDRTTFRFDDHDNPIEGNSEHTSREVGMGEQGKDYRRSNIERRITYYQPEPH